MAIIFSDTFTGTNGAAPAADWTVSGTTGATETIQGNALQFHTGVLGGFADVSRAILTKTGTTTFADFEVLLSVAFSTAFPPTYGLTVFGRGSGDWANSDNPNTWVRAELDTDGSCNLAYRLNSGTKTTIVSGGAGTVSGITAGQAFWFRFRCTGTSIAGKWWKNDGTTPEPAAWTLSGTQNVVNTGGNIQMRNLGGSAASSIDLLVDNFSLDNLIGTSGMGWYSRGGTRQAHTPRLASRDFAHRRSSF